MNMKDLTIRRAHEGLKNKDFSAVELNEAYLERISAHNDDLNVCLTVTENEALKQAEKIDEQIAKGEDIDVLAGIPIGVKDMFCTKGIRTTAASNILKDFVPPYDSTAYARLKEKGTTIVGKSNTDEFACGCSTENSAFGVTKNPWNRECVAGGSSGGPAAGVAAGMFLGALGTDTGGSIRQPASFCNVVGLKVTYGRVSRSGVVALASSFDTIGPFSRTVEDAALILQAIAGHDDRDSTTPPIEVPDYSKSLGQDVKGMKIGIPSEFFGEGVRDDVKALVMAAIKEYEKMGCEIKEVSLPHMEYAIAVYYILMPSELSANLARYDSIRFGTKPSEEGETFIDHYLKARAQGFGDEIKRRIMIGTYSLSAGYYDAYYARAQKVRTLIRQDFDNAFNEVDALMAPVSPFPAFKIGEKVDDPLQMYLADACVGPASCAGVPGISVPCGFSKDNLPVGLQIIAPQFEEARLLKLASAYEQVKGIPDLAPL